jgi:WS/DGAT/MGAT family acyltransferase
LLVVSATIGEGHNATARAVEERARQLWPGCEIRRVDTLDVMGSWVGPGFRWIYRVNVDTTPWLYDFFYRALWRYRWFATASCRVVGTWSGLRLAPIIAEYRPDLVVSTYPLGTGGLDWMRRRGELDVPVAAIISDFAPHPFWVYPGIDLHYVASEPSLRAMHRARPEARGAIGAPPVITEFHPADKSAARLRCGLPASGFIVLVSCGSLGFGSMERAVEAGLAAGPEVCVVVACGRNEALRARLIARGEPAPRLVALGWTSQMPALTAAADVVVTNAGGATALEAVACGRAVLMFEPIAGHGKANAAVMAQAGLATVCRGPAELVAALRELVASPARLAAAERRALAHIGGLDLAAEIAALPGLARHGGARPLSALDAFFVHAATEAVPQQVGAVLLLESSPPSSAQAHLTAPSDPAEQLAADLAARITERVPTLPVLRRRVVLRRGRRPRWLPAAEVDTTRHVRARTVGTAHGVGWTAAMREFFDTPLSLANPPWQLEVIRDASSGRDGRTAVLAKMHHCLGDGLTVAATLIGLLSDRPPRPDPPLPPAPLPPAPRAAGWRTRALRATRVLRGLASLAGAGFAPPGGPAGSGGPGQAARDYALAELPAARVRATARAHGVGTTALLLALVAEAVHRSDPAGTATDDRLRAMVPRTTQPLRRAGSVDHDRVNHNRGNHDGGNHTAAVALDLPVGPMPPACRVTAVAAALADSERHHQPLAAQTVVRALGRLPAPLHAVVVRAIYRRRFFTLIASVLPGPRRAHYVREVRVVSAFPVLPLADGVGLAVGFLTWGGMIGVGVTATTGSLPGADRFATVLREAFDDLARNESGVHAMRE